MSEIVPKKETITIYDECLNCTHKGTDFKLNLKTNYITCPECKTWWKL